MKTVWLIGVALFAFFCSFGQAKEDNESKKDKGNQEAAYRQGETSNDQGPGFDSPQYNNNQVGDGHTEEDDQGDSGQADDAGDQQGRVEEGISGAQNTDDTQLLGEDNRKAKGGRDSQRSSNYRNNKVSGNPNNTTISGGSNRQAGSPENPESSEAVPSGNQQQSVQSGDNPTPGGSTSGANQTPDSENTQGTSSQSTGASGMTGNSNEAGTNANDTGSSSSNTQATGTPSVIQNSSTQSGSPAMKADDGTRDGTNNVQRAKPNMAGSEVSDIRSNGKSVNEDTEIRKGTMQQQINPDRALAEQQQNQGGQNVGGNTTPATSNAAPNNTSRTPQKQPSDSDQPARVTDEAAKTVGEEKGQQGESSQQTPDVKAMDTQPDLVTEKDQEEKKKDRKSRKKRNRKNRD